MIEYLVSLSLLAAIVLLIRGIFRKTVSPRAIYALWLVVVIRMLLPITLFEVGVTLPEFMQSRSAAETEQGGSSEELPMEPETNADAEQNPVTPPVQTPTFPLESTAPTIPVIPSVTPVTPVTPVIPVTPIIPTETTPVMPVVPGIDREEVTVPDIPTVEVPDVPVSVNWKGIANLVWFIGAAIAAVWVILTTAIYTGRLYKDREYYKTLRGIKVYISKSAGVPCIAGLKPSIYITPEAANSKSETLILVHEYVHLRHGDHIWAVVRALALIVFWWNPLILAAAVVSKQDAELACDDAISAKMNEEGRLKYANILFDTIPKTPRYGDRLNSFHGLGSAPMKERILMLTTKQKNKWICVILAVVLALCAVGCAFVSLNEKEMETDEPNESAVETTESEVQGEIDEKDENVVLNIDSHQIVKTSKGYAVYEKTGDTVSSEALGCFLDFRELRYFDKDDVIQTNYLLVEKTENGQYRFASLSDSGIEPYERAYTAYSFHGDFVLLDHFVVHDGNLQHIGLAHGEISSVTSLEDGGIITFADPNEGVTYSYFHMKRVEEPERKSTLAYMGEYYSYGGSSRNSFLAVNNKHYLSTGHECYELPEKKDVFIDSYICLNSDPQEVVFLYYENMDQANRRACRIMPVREGDNISVYGQAVSYPVDSIIGSKYFNRYDEYRSSYMPDVSWLVGANSMFYAFFGKLDIVCDGTYILHTVPVLNEYRLYELSIITDGGTYGSAIEQAAVFDDAVILEDNAILAKAKGEEKVILYNRDGTIQSTTAYEKVLDLGQYGAAVAVGDEVHFVDTSGNLLASVEGYNERYRFDPQSSGLFKPGGRYDVVFVDPEEGTDPITFWYDPNTGKAGRREIDLNGTETQQSEYTVEIPLEGERDHITVAAVYGKAPSYSGSPRQNVIRAGLDGTQYIVMGVADEWEYSGNFKTLRTYRVTSKNGYIESVEETETFMRDVIKQKGKPYTGELDGLFRFIGCPLQWGEFGSGLNTYSVYIPGDGTIYAAYGFVDMGGTVVYEGTYQYDSATGALTAKLVGRTANNGEITYLPEAEVSGKLYEYGGFVHFICESSEINGLSAYDPHPLTFVPNTDGYADPEPIVLGEEFNGAWRSDFTDDRGEQFYGLSVNTQTNEISFEHGYTGGAVNRFVGTYTVNPLTYVTTAKFRPLDDSLESTEFTMTFTLSYSISAEGVRVGMDIRSFDEPTYQNLAGAWIAFYQASEQKHNTLSELPEGFEEFYHEAEKVYALFTGHPGKVYAEGTIKVGSHIYQAADINGYTSLAELRALCEQYFDSELTEQLMAKTVGDAPLYIEQDGKLYRYSGYVAQYSIVPEDYGMVLEAPGSETVHVLASFYSNDIQYTIRTSALCTCIVTEDGNLRFTSFTLMAEAIQNEMDRGRTFTVYSPKPDPSKGEILVKVASYGDLNLYGTGYIGMEGLIGDGQVGKVGGVGTGIGFITYGLGTLENGKVNFTSYYTARLEALNGYFIGFSREDTITRGDVLLNGTPYQGSLDGIHICEAADPISGMLIYYKAEISGNSIKLQHGPSGTGGSGWDEGEFTYDSETGMIRAVMTHQNSNVESMDQSIGHQREFSGRLYLYDGFVHFIVDRENIPENSVPLTFKPQIVINDLAYWDKLPWAEEKYGVSKPASSAYSFIHNMVSGESEIPEYNGLGIKDYSVELLEDDSGFYTLRFNFTVTGNSLPETLPPGTYSWILSDGIGLSLYTEGMPNKGWESTEYSKRVYGLDRFENNSAVQAVHAYLTMRMPWNLPPYGEWDISSGILPSNYICKFYGDRHMAIDFDEMQRLLSEKFGISIEKPTEDERFDRCMYTKATDMVQYADTRAFISVHRFLDIREEDGVTYVIVQLFADQHRIIPSHKVQYAIGEGDVFLGCEIIQEGKYLPY